MANRRGPALTTLPENIHPDQRLTIEQACLLRGCGRSKFYADEKAGLLKIRIERSAGMVRVRAGDLIDAMNEGFA